MHSPLLDSVIIFISCDEEKTKSILNVIRRSEVSRRVLWFRNFEQVYKFFEEHFEVEINTFPHAISIILDYDLEGVAKITSYIEQKGALKTCALFSLKSVVEEMAELIKQLKMAN